MAILQREVLKVVMTLMLMRTGITAKNVLMLVSDDVGRELKVYGNTAIKMPNLDRLTEQSVTFTSAYTSVSSCSPSRSAILTGLPTHQNGMYGLHHDVHHFNSFDQVLSLPKILSDQGVRTGIIGKKHIGPDAVYPFDFAHTPETDNLLQVTRNITFIRNLVREFFSSNDSRPFFLYIGFMDAHRCFGKYGNFCEKFGNGQPGFGSIPDWTPIHYSPSEVVVPYFIQNTSAAREDLATQYLSLSRLDQGVGLVLKELEAFGHAKDTIVIYTADNGIPFPSAKTNLYHPGSVEPLVISSPDHTSSWGNTTSVVASLLDLTPTVLDWFQIPYPDYHIFPNQPTKLTGKSLLKYLNTSNSVESGEQNTINFHAQATQQQEDDLVVYGSHQFHEITMDYPMRSIHTSNYRLIHNLNYLMPYPIALDVFYSPTFQDILNRTHHEEPLPWYKTLKQYYYRDQWELYDLKQDPEELHNVAEEKDYREILKELQKKLKDWQIETYDPWQCSPDGIQNVLENGCLPLYNGV